MPSHSGQKEEEMDCNSYSYASGRGGITVIAEYGAGIELSREINMFGDVYYFVSNVWESSEGDEMGSKEYEAVFWWLHERGIRSQENACWKFLPNDDEMLYCVNSRGEVVETCRLERIVSEGRELMERKLFQAFA